MLVLSQQGPGAGPGETPAAAGKSAAAKRSTKRKAPGADAADATEDVLLKLKDFPANAHFSDILKRHNQVLFSFFVCPYPCKCCHTKWAQVPSAPSCHTKSASEQ